MALYAISYDLSAPTRNYDALYEAIKALGPWSHTMKSFWMVRSTLSAADIRDRLKKVIDSNDQLLVAALTGEWASAQLGAVHVSWLKAS